MTLKELGNIQVENERLSILVAKGPIESKTFKKNLMGRTSEGHAFRFCSL